MSDDGQARSVRPTGPEREEVDLPAWVEDQFDRNRTIPLWDGREISMDEAESLLNTYVEELRQDATARFSASADNRDRTAT